MDLYALGLSWEPTLVETLVGFYSENLMLALFDFDYPNTGSVFLVVNFDTHSASILWQSLWQSSLALWSEASWAESRALDSSGVCQALKGNKPFSLDLGLEGSTPLLPPWVRWTQSMAALSRESSSLIYPFTSPSPLFLYPQNWRGVSTEKKLVFRSFLESFPFLSILGFTLVTDT